MSEETKTVELTKDKEVLIVHRNNFRKALINSTLDLLRHEQMQKIDPKYQRKDQSGKYIGINELIEEYKKSASNAKSYVEIVDELLKMDQADGLDSLFNNFSEKTEEKTKEQDSIEDGEKEE